MEERVIAVTCDTKDRLKSAERECQCMSIVLFERCLSEAKRQTDGCVNDVRAGHLGSARNTHI